MSPGRAGRRDAASSVAPVSLRIRTLPASLPRPDHRAPATRPRHGRNSLMPRLPEIVLDDRHFQDLVNEARVRVARRCPEWTDHNVSDPGITLIELFAWLTETLVYRVNRIPAKLHVALLELLGMRLRPPTAATTDIRFRLAAPPEDEDVVIAGGETEVATQRLGPEQPVVFQTEQDFTIPVARPTAYAVERDGKAKDVGVARGVASPKGPDQLPFASPSTARRPRARESTRRTRRCGGRSPSATASGLRPTSSSTARAASTTAAASWS